MSTNLPTFVSTHSLRPSPLPTSSFRSAPPPRTQDSWPTLFRWPDIPAMDIPMFGSIFMLSTEYALMAWQAVYVRVYPHGYDTGLFEWYKKDEAIAALLDKVEAQAGPLNSRLVQSQ